MSWYTDPEIWKAIGIYAGVKFATPAAASVTSGWILYKMAAYREKKAEQKRLKEFEETQNNISQRIQNEIERQKNAQKKQELKNSKEKMEHSINALVEYLKVQNRKKTDLDYFKSFFNFYNTSTSFKQDKNKDPLNFMIDMDEEKWQEALKTLNEYNKLAEEKGKQKGDEQD